MELREAVATFASQAAVKLRRQDLVAERIAVFIETDRHAPPEVEQYGPWTGFGFPPTNVQGSWQPMPGSVCSGSSVHSISINEPG